MNQQILFWNFFFDTTRNLTFIKEFTYLVFFCTCIFVLLLELKNIYLLGKLLAKLFNLFSKM